MIINDMLEADIEITFDHIQRVDKLVELGSFDKHIVHTTINNSINYTHNFYGLLSTKLLLPKEYWYVYLKINGYTNPMEYDGHVNIKTVGSEILEIMLKN